MTTYYNQNTMTTPIEYMCSLCENKCEGWGNNPYPLCEESDMEARCCDSCNMTKVLPARIKAIVEDEEDEWEEVYNKPERFGKYCPPGNKELAKLKKGVYYQTFGGGPEGGYVLLTNGDVYSVKRGWFEPFKATKLNGKRIEYEAEDEMKGKTARLRVM